MSSISPRAPRATTHRLGPRSAHRTTHCSAHRSALGLGLAVGALLLTLLPTGWTAAAGEPSEPLVELGPPPGKCDIGYKRLCHLDDARGPMLWQTTCVPLREVRAHLPHGDHLLPCEQIRPEKLALGPAEHKPVRRRSKPTEGCSAGQVAVCHGSHGKKRHTTPKTLCLSAPEAEKHFKVGDTKGSCKSAAPVSTGSTGLGPLAAPTASKDLQYNCPDGKISVCHQQVGAQKARRIGAVSLCIDPSDLKGHKAHGDTEGICLFAPPPPPVAPVEVECPPGTHAICHTDGKQRQTLCVVESMKGEHLTHGDVAGACSRP